MRLADEVEAHGDELAELECLDNGKSFALARRVDLKNTVEFLRYIAGWATKIEGTTVDDLRSRDSRRDSEYYRLYARGAGRHRRRDYYLELSADDEQPSKIGPG